MSIIPMDRRQILDTTVTSDGMITLPEKMREYLGGQFRSPRASYNFSKQFASDEGETRR